MFYEKQLDVHYVLIFLGDILYMFPKVGAPQNSDFPIERIDSLRSV